MNIKLVMLTVVFVVLVALQATLACDCNYHKGGCALVKPAPSGKACKCVYRGAWTCAGRVVGCVDQDHKLCKNPDTSKASCQFANGDCGGY